MSRTTYAPKEEYLGTGLLDTYTFDFKIEAKTQLEVVEVNDSNVETQRVRGDDTTYLSSVTFDAQKGAGTVVLASNLPDGYTLLLLLANDAPTQPYIFRNLGSFTLKQFEYALDWLAGSIQRLTYRSKQAFRIHDADDQDAFDAQFPPNIAVDGLDRVLQINATGDGVEFGPTATEVENAQAYALAAAAAQTAAEAAQTAAEAAQTDAEAAQTAAELAQSIVEAYYTPIATQTITVGGDINHTQTLLGYRQFRRIIGDGTAVTTSNTPFGTTPTYFVDGMVIKLECQSSGYSVTINHNDSQYGCLLNGNWKGEKGGVLELTYNSTLERFIESFRSK